MRDFMFEIVGENSNCCGEQFFVECDTLEEAWTIVYANFGDEEIKYCGRCSIDEAEAIGLDTY